MLKFGTNFTHLKIIEIFGSWPRLKFSTFWHTPHFDFEDLVNCMWRSFGQALEKETVKLGSNSTHPEILKIVGSEGRLIRYPPPPRPLDF